jgi:hypothetical protein
MKKKFFQRRKPETTLQPPVQPMMSADDLERLSLLSGRASELLNALYAAQDRYTDTLADAFPPLAAAFEEWATAAELFVDLAKRFNLREGYEVEQAITAGRGGMEVLRQMGVREERSVKWPEFLAERTQQ